MDSLSSHIHDQMPQQALSARGTITHVNGSLTLGPLSVWTVGPTERWVDVVTTATHGAVPRYYRCVGWNSAPGHLTLGGFSAPKEGDGVLIGFMNGSSEFPYVIAHYPGGATQEAIEQAQAPRPSTPSRVFQAAHLGLDAGEVISGNPLSGLLDLLNNL